RPRTKERGARGPGRPETRRDDADRRDTRDRLRPPRRGPGGGAGRGDDHRGRPAGPGAGQPANGANAVILAPRSRLTSGSQARRRALRASGVRTREDSLHSSSGLWRLRKLRGVQYLMTKRLITVGHSPDPDDAFMFYALAHDKLDTGDLQFRHELQDIETLNRRALRGELEVTAGGIPAHAYFQDKYPLFPSRSRLCD